MRQEQFRFRNSRLSSTASYPPSSPRPPRQIVFVNEGLEAGQGGAPSDEIVSPWRKVLSSSSAHGSQSDGRQNDNEIEQMGSPGRDLSWPVDREQEAFLIRHFTSTVSHFFDFCDPRRHFARVVPQRMRSNPTLANAVFALSARHFSRISTFDAYVADVYYQRCLQQLIPALANNVQDESLLVAAVILRLMEEIDVPVTGADHQNHLLGTQAIARAQEQRLAHAGHASGLLKAAHWAALRQDLYMAFAIQRPLLLNSLDFFRPPEKSRGAIASVEAKSNDEEDARWADLAVLQCCDVAQFVFGSNRGDLHEYERLQSVSEHWRHDRPSSFEPFFHRPRRPQSPIPDIRLLSNWHVMGYMYHWLSRALLDLNRPSKSTDHEKLGNVILSAVCEMVGIALHNPHTPSAHLVASMAIAMCACRLIAEAEEPELDAMKQVLADTERLHGWPTRAAQQALER